MVVIAAAGAVGRRRLDRRGPHPCRGARTPQALRPERVSRPARARALGGISSPFPQSAGPDPVAASAVSALTGEVASFAHRHRHGAAERHARLRPGIPRRAGGAAPAPVGTDPRDRAARRRRQGGAGKRDRARRRGVARLRQSRTCGRALARGAPSVREPGAVDRRILSGGKARRRHGRRAKRNGKPRPMRS